MSISSEISRISGNISDSLTAVANKGVTVPSGSNSDDLAGLIAQISSGGTGAISIVDTADSGGGTVRTITAVDISDTTAAAADVASGKYFYTADGTKTAGTASGSGGLVYETGTYTPASDTVQPTISFANTHSTKPFAMFIADTTGTSQTTNYSETSWGLFSWYNIFGTTINTGASSSYYGRYQGTYRNTSNNMTTTGGNDTSTNSSYFSSTEFKPSNGSSYYWRSGRTYKWIAVWAPTT